MGSDPVPTTMTNGLFSGVDPAAPGPVPTTMTNGTVVASEGGAGRRVLTVSLTGTKDTARITVSPSAPVTRFVPADRAAVPVGSTVFVKTDPGSKAALDEPDCYVFCERGRLCYHRREGHMEDERHVHRSAAERSDGPSL